MPKPLPLVVTIRISSPVAEQLDRLVKQHRLARRAAVAREALQRGLTSMLAELGKQ